MRGQLLDYSIHENRGTITTAEGNRYYFGSQEWKGGGTPTRGMMVDFEVDGTNAKGVFAALEPAATSDRKDKVAAGLLGVFLGGLGIHKFYLGFTGPGLVFLLVNTVGWTVSWLLLFLPNIVLGLIGFIEGIIYLTKSDEEFQQLYVVEKKQWF